jgi:DNA-binding XRE family transcriptional regulator
MLRVILNRPALEKAIVRHNLTRKDLALQIGLSRGYLSKMIWGKQEPTATLRQKLLEVFKECTFEDLFSIEDRPDQAQRRIGEHKKEQKICQG